MPPGGPGEQQNEEIGNQGGGRAKRRSSSISSSSSMSQFEQHRRALGNSGFSTLQGQQKHGKGGGRQTLSPRATVRPSPSHKQRKQGSPKKKKQKQQDDEEGNAVKRREKKRRARTFPEKLMQAMVEGPANENAVAWLPDGKSFVVVDADLFVTDILSIVFKECKYASFVRKLHRWGFVRLTSGTGTDCFHHPLFQKGRRDLASKITCAGRDKDQPVKGGRFDKPPSLAGVERFIRARAVAAAQQAGASGLPPFGTSAPPSAAAQAVAAAAAATPGQKKPAVKAGASPSVAAKPSDGPTAAAAVGPSAGKADTPDPSDTPGPSDTPEPKPAAPSGPSIVAEAVVPEAKKEEEGTKAKEEQGQDTEPFAAHAANGTVPTAEAPVACM